MHLQERSYWVIRCSMRFFLRNSYWHISIICFAAHRITALIIFLLHCHCRQFLFICLKFSIISTEKCFFIVAHHSSCTCIFLCMQSFFLSFSYSGFFFTKLYRMNDYQKNNEREIQISMASAGKTEIHLRFHRICNVSSSPFFHMLQKSSSSFVKGSQNPIEDFEWNISLLSTRIRDEWNFLRQSLKKHTQNGVENL